MGWEGDLRIIAWCAFRDRTVWYGGLYHGFDGYVSIVMFEGFGLGKHQCPSGGERLTIFASLKMELHCYLTTEKKFSQMRCDLL